MNGESPQPGDRRRWYQHLGPRLGAVVVFLVAVTTLIGNVFELTEKRRAAEISVARQSAATPVAATASIEVEPAAPVKLQLQLDRIAVQHDGSAGTTDWRFTVEGDGAPLLAFELDDLDDAGGRNVRRPEDIKATLRPQAGQKTLKLSVQGWRLSRLRSQSSQPDATGHATVRATAGEVSVQVQAADAEGGAFVFYFAVDPQ